MTRASGFESLIRALDKLEAQTTRFVTTEDVTMAGGDAETLKYAITLGVVLVDHRMGFDASTGTTEEVTLCRLNRQHPEVQRLVGESWVGDSDAPSGRQQLPRRRNPGRG